MVMPAICAVYIYVIVYVNSRVTVFRVVISKERERGEILFTMQGVQHTKFATCRMNKISRTSK